MPRKVTEEINEEEEEEEELDEDEDELEDDDDAEESESEEEDEDDNDKPRRRKSRAFVKPPPREPLPQRTTRGLRVGALAAATDDQADEEFWNQEFFAEEERDVQYETESEPEDLVDADFMQSEGEDDDGEEAEEEARAREPKRKTLRPPGYKRPPPHAAAGGAGPSKKISAVGASEQGEEEAEEEAPLPATKKARRRSSIDANAIAGIPAERTIAVRESTRTKVQVAEEERKYMEQKKPRRASRPTVHRQLTQAELLAEAARTEIENTRSLQYLVAIEEETKKKANIKKGHYVGPMVRFHSARVEDEEKTTLEVRNMQPPAYLQPQTAPPPRPRATCVITGQPAKYRDPTTGLAYADVAAFKELKARREQQLAAAQVQRQQQQYHPYQQQQYNQVVVQNGAL